MKENYALITGASQGLGKAIALELVERKYNLLLVSLPNENISDLTKEVMLQGINAHYFETDLTKKENVIALANWANEFSISVLINNAGCGGSIKITEASIDYIDTMIQLNITATSLITRLLIPNLTQHTNSYILNISSMAAFSPIGYKSVYPASKKFIEFFSQGLNEELKDEGVSITVIYPGPMRTNDNVTSRIAKQNKIINSGVVELDQVAKISLNGMFRGKKMIIPGKLNKVVRFILAVLPRKSKIHLLSKAVKKELDEEQ